MPDDEEDALDEALHAELARRGLTLDTWAAKLRAEAQAVIDRSARARRVRVVKVAAAAGVALAAAAAGGVTALRAMQCRMGGAEVQQSMRGAAPGGEGEGGGVP